MSTTTHAANGAGPTEEIAQDNRGRFVWHELDTPDPDAAAAFYTEVVGWTTSRWADSPVDYTMFMAGETAVGGLARLADEQVATGRTPGWFAYTAVPDVDATVAEAARLGATALVPPQTLEGVGRLSVLRDPQGPVFAVIRGETSSPIPEERAPEPFEFVWHELATTDGPAALAFYERILGWEKKREFDMGKEGIYHIYGRGPFEYGGMMTLPVTVDMPPYWLHYIGVPDSADAAAERAQKLGANLIMGPMDVPGGDRVAILVDPQGVMFAVHGKGGE